MYFLYSPDQRPIVSLPYIDTDHYCIKYFLFMAEAARKPSLLESLIPIVLLIVLLFTNVVIFGDDVLGGSNQVALVFSAAVAALLGVRLGRKWDVILEGILYNINAAMTSILILLLIGALAG